MFLLLNNLCYVSVLCLSAEALPTIKLIRAAEDDEIGVICSARYNASGRLVPKLKLKVDDHVIEMNLTTNNSPSTGTTVTGTAQVTTSSPVKCTVLLMSPGDSSAEFATNTVEISSSSEALSTPCKFTTFVVYSPE